MADEPRGTRGFSRRIRRKSEEFNHTENRHFGQCLSNIPLTLKKVFTKGSVEDVSSHSLCRAYTDTLGYKGANLEFIDEYRIVGKMEA